MLESLNPGVAVGLGMAWLGVALVALVFAVISALRVLVNGFRTSRQLADARLRTISLIATVSIVVTASTAFVFPAVAVFAALVWPLALAKVVSRLEALGHSVNAHYRLALGASLAFFGVSALAFPAIQVATMAASRPWDEIEIGLLWLLFGAVLLSLAINGVVMITASVGLLRRRSPAQSNPPIEAGSGV